MKRNSKKYRKIWESTNGPIPVDEQGRSYEIHHIDGDSNNNSLSNLRCLSMQDHYEIHEQQGDYEACHAIKLRMDNSPLVGWKHSESTKSKISSAKKGQKQSASAVAAMRKSKLGKKHTPSVITKISNAHKVPIVHNLTGTMYESSLAAAIANGVSGATIHNKLKKGEFRTLQVYEQVNSLVFSTTPCIVKQKAGDTQKKQIMHAPTGVVYQSASEAAKQFGWSPNNVGYYINKGIFKYI